VTHRGKGADPEKAGTGSPSPDPPSSSLQTPFERFEKFARKVVSVPRSEMEERERAYREKHPKKVPA
jgi:hypothetical protein